MAFHVELYTYCECCYRPDVTKRCSECHDTYYCDEYCQRKHWPSHKLWCVTYQLEELKKRVGAFAEPCHFKEFLRFSKPIELKALDRYLQLWIYGILRAHDDPDHIIARAFNLAPCIEDMRKEAMTDIVYMLLVTHTEAQCAKVARIVNTIFKGAPVLLHLHGYGSDNSFIRTFSAGRVCQKCLAYCKMNTTCDECFDNAREVAMSAFYSNESYIVMSLFRIWGARLRVHACDSRTVICGLANGYCLDCIPGFVEPLQRCCYTRIMTEARDDTIESRTRLVATLLPPLFEQLCDIKFKERVTACYSGELQLLYTLLLRDFPLDSKFRIPLSLTHIPADSFLQRIAKYTRSPDRESIYLFTASVLGPTITYRDVRNAWGTFAAREFALVCADKNIEFIVDDKLRNVRPVIRPVDFERSPQLALALIAKEDVPRKTLRKYIVGGMATEHKEECMKLVAKHIGLILRDPILLRAVWKKSRQPRFEILQRGLRERADVLAFGAMCCPDSPLYGNVDRSIIRTILQYV